MESSITEVIVETISGDKNKTMDNDIFGNFVALSRYCKWDESLGRRETWPEAVSRYFTYLRNRFSLFGNDKLNECEQWMLKKEVFGSMRALMTAGKALDNDDVSSYNCSYVSVDSLESFRNIMYVLMCGTGVGFSVEREAIDKLPTIPSQIIKDFTKVIMVEDSRAGWADAYLNFLKEFINGTHVKVDTSKVRPAGARLKTFGGRASGPEPFLRLITFTANKLYEAKGRKLRPIEVHDIVCSIAEVVICGGVRRSALISLSDLNDSEMSHAKSGPWWEVSKYRSLANNSAVFTEKPPMEVFLKEWSNLYISRSGERGIANREAMVNIAKRSGRETDGIKFGTNPCSEIILQPNQFCNLSTVVIKPDDTKESLLKKIELATILGTIQSAMTNFTFFNERGDFSWHNKCTDERLLGVSMTGIYDNILTSGGLGPEMLKDLLTNLKLKTHEVNQEWASLLGIESSKAITCIKPEGTTSCVGGSSSGLHPRFSSHYIRRIRLASNDPIGNVMKEAGIPNEPCVNFGSTTDVYSFPIAAPYGVTKEMINAVGHLELWAMYQIFYCDHKPSITVSYSDEDFLAIGNWIWKYWNIVSGISFLPEENSVYIQAPFEKIDKETYESLMKSFPKDIDWSRLSYFEREDNSINTKELACSAGGCEII